MKNTHRLLALAALMALACKGKPGDACKGAGVCEGRDSALLCGPSYKYVKAACNGPDGCVDSPFRCDFRENAGGEPCSDRTDGHPMHCTADKKARVRCADGKVDRDECDGPKGCFPKSETTMGCDRALKAGGACGVEGEWCSTDGKARLACASGKLVVTARCRGPKGCTSGTGHVETALQTGRTPGDITDDVMERVLGDLALCDVSVAEAGDECTLTRTVCSVDGTSVLVCRGGKFDVEKACGAGGSCRSTTSGATCAAR